MKVNKICKFLLISFHKMANKFLIEQIPTNFIYLRSTDGFILIFLTSIFISFLE